jgi:hypothetical protein
MEVLQPSTASLRWILEWRELLSVDAKLHLVLADGLLAHALLLLQ